MKKNELNQELVNTVVSNKLDLVQSYLNQGAKINFIDSDGTTTLNWAVHLGHTDIVEILIKHGADVNARDIKNNHSFMFSNIY